MRTFFSTLLLAVLVLMHMEVQAHKPSDSYLSVKVADQNIEGQWDIALRDLDLAIGIDTNGDGNVTWGEIRSLKNEIAAYAFSRLAFTNGGKQCPIIAGALLIDEHSDGAYAVLKFSAACSASVNQLNINYRLLFDVDPQHRGLLNLQSAAQTSTAIFSPDSASQTLAIAEASKWTQFVVYAKSGIWHIWIGFDHILFLLSLLLPAVFISSRKQRVPSESFKVSLIDVVKIVSAFTLAHSVTLSLAALQIISLPSRLVESAIAASVVLAALNNLYPIIHDRRWVAALVFGLIHGFGFASVLTDLGLPRESLILSLIGFNSGVEIGQLAIVSIFLPVAYMIRRTGFYRNVVFTGGSMLIAVLASIWFVERAFDMTI